MDIIERLWIAHAELPGRQLLMRDAITEIQRSRDENENLAAAARMADRRNEELRKALRDMLDWADTPSQEASPAWITGACYRARALLNTESEE